MSLRSRTKAKTSTRVRSWGVSVIRSRAHFLGWVEAPDAKAAEIAAVRAFNLSEEQRKRLWCGSAAEGWPVNLLPRWGHLCAALPDRLEFLHSQK